MTFINLIVKRGFQNLNLKCLRCLRSGLVSQRFRQGLGFVDLTNGPVFMCLVCGVRPTRSPLWLRLIVSHTNTLELLLQWHYRSSYRHDKRLLMPSEHQVWCYHFWLISQSHHQQGTLLLHSSVTIWSSFVNLNGHTEKQSDWIHDVFPWPWDRKDHTPWLGLVFFSHSRTKYYCEITREKGEMY